MIYLIKFADFELLMYFNSVAVEYNEKDDLWTSRPKASSKADIWPVAFVGHNVGNVDKHGLEQTILLPRK
jgi:hypothetical protein